VPNYLQQEMQRIARGLIVVNYCYAALRDLNQGDRTRAGRG
jgi:hypothetical protein